MPAFPRLISRPTIASRLVAWFLLISLIPCAILTWLVYSVSSKFLEQTVRRNYLVIAESKGAQVEAMAQEKIRSVVALTRSPTILAATTNLDAVVRIDGVESAGFRQTTSEYRSFLVHTALSYNYLDFMLVSPAGQILFSMRQPNSAGSFVNVGPMRDSELANVFNRAKTLVQTEISDFEINPGMREPAVFIAGPILKSGSVVGVMIFRLNNDEIYRVFSDYQGLGETGEIMVGSRVGDEVVVVAPLRFDEEAVLNRRFGGGLGGGDPIQQAVRGRHGYGQFTDYRGRECVGFWTYLPSFRWGMVVKQESSEALALIEVERRVTLFLLSLMIIPVTLAALLIARSITRPIRVAARTAEKVASGDLTAEFRIRKMDETGQLLLAIRSMTATLKGHYETMEEKIRQRTRELEESNRQLQTARELAEEANRAKTAFLANMSHELRTPLNAIIGYTEVLIEESHELQPADFVPDLERVLTAGRHLLALINDILDLSKIEAGKTELYLEEFEIRPVIDEVAATIEPLSRQNGNELNIECPASVGAMRADITKIRQALYNLLSNACKFTEKGRVLLQVRPETRSGSSWVDFVIEDTGIGMSNEQLSRLFQPFSQADPSTTRKYGGTGLGLAITRRFAKMMGGEVLVRSELGRGTTFTLTVPREVADPKAIVRVPELVAPPVAAETGANVLVVDDDADTRELLTRLLTREGFVVRCAASGQEALELARARKPDAITLDVLMPGLDGWSVLTALKADPQLSGVPVIMLTLVDQRESAYALGVADYLTKPIDKTALMRVLDRYCHLAPLGDVLVVDDDVRHLETLRSILESEGISVRVASGARDGLALAHEKKPNVVLLDLLMPEMDGFEFVRTLQDDPALQGIHVIVVTASDLAAEEFERLGGVDGVVRKAPDHRSEILKVLRRFIPTVSPANSSTSPNGKVRAS